MCACLKAASTVASWQVTVGGLGRAGRFKLKRRPAKKCRSKSWSEFFRYLDRFALVQPTRLTDLIAMSRANPMRG
ncbi:hypothetical protein CGZ80_20800 [Rhodopirellula sp. MGV]|nr:hypothetical protein CGZ80_20800 [Rhodopirellula sp. MGV]PNY36812.1 hypothetical protein C2E31_11060 [Rhodopirellula baltica]